MSDSPNSPVIQAPMPPKPNISQNARAGVMAAMRQMAGGSTSQKSVRHGKHNGRKPGAFGKQR